jgi:2-dehydropantoate 2-reductase
MKHAVIGAGGVGGLIGAVLAHEGEQVSMVVRRGTLRNYSGTLHLESPFCKCDESVAWTEQLSQADVVWLTVKAPQLDAAMEVLAAGPLPRAIVPLLNGVEHVASLRNKFGHERVIPATIAVETERIAPGRIVHRSPFARLHMASSGKALLAGTMEQLQGVGFTCVFVDEEATLLWQKIVFLGPIALSTTAANKPIGDLVADPALWQRLKAGVHEACEAGRAEGAKLNEEVVINSIKTLPPGMRSSMQKDVEQGKQPELDAIGGAIVRAAARHGINTPVLSDLIRAVEGRTRATSEKVAG